MKEVVYMEEYEYPTPWYLSNVIIIAIVCLGTFIPFISFLALPPLILRFKGMKKHYNDIRDLIKKDIEQAKETASNIIHAAESKAEDIERSKTASLFSLDEKISNRQSIMEQIIKDASADAEASLVDIKSHLSNINAEIEKKDFYINEVNRIKEEITSLDKKVSSRQEKIDHLMSIQKSVNNAIKTYFKNSTAPYDQSLVLPQEFIKDITTLAPSITLKLHSMDYKDLRRAFKANEKLIDETLTRYEGRYTTKTNRAIYQLMVIGLRAELQNVLFTLTYSKLNEAIAAIKEITNKYLNIARDGSQTISSTLAKFIGELEPLFIDSVKIEYEYYTKKEAARQEQVALREQMREEAEERRILKEQAEQMEKESSKYKTEIENINQQLLFSTDAEKKQQLLEKAKELEIQLKNIEDRKEEIINLQNGKAGYVYVISNLGSFGDDVFKVGMTRRLDPQERIDELGNASVPFKFDVHSFIFSENAVQLESDLHTALESNRLNKVNSRKEFFKIPFDDIETLVDKFDPTAEFNKTMFAEQYHQSLSIAEEDTSASEEFISA